MTDIQRKAMCERIERDGISIDDLTDAVMEKLGARFTQEELNQLLQQDPLPDEIEDALIDVFGLDNLEQNGKASIRCK